MDNNRELRGASASRAVLVLVCGLSSYWTYYLCAVRHQQSASSLVVPREANMWWLRGDRSAPLFTRGQRPRGGPGAGPYKQGTGLLATSKTSAAPGSLPMAA